MWHCICSVTERYFSLFLITAFCAGLFVPGIDKAPPYLVSVLIGIIIFLSCTKISFQEITKIKPLQLSGFFLVRYSVVPAALFVLALLFVPSLAPGVLLLALLPCGVTIPAWSGMLNGNVSLSLCILVVSSAAIPFLIPAAYGLIGMDNLDVDIWGLFQNLLLVVFLPIGLYFFFIRTRQKVRAALSGNAGCLTVLFISAALAIVVSTQREYFFSDMGLLVKAMIVAVIVNIILYGFGWFWPGHPDRSEKISLSLSSGGYNLALGINLAFLYFPPAVSLFMVLCEIPWILGLSAFKLIISKKNA